MSEKDVLAYLHHAVRFGIPATSGSSTGKKDSTLIYYTIRLNTRWATQTPNGKSGK
jgi:hypothetical protein